MREHSRGSAAPEQAEGDDDQTTAAPAPSADGSASSPRPEPVLTPPVLLAAPSQADGPGAYRVVLERGALAPQLRTQALEGRVVLRVLVLADGGVGQAEFERSSGQTALDQAAVAAARSWRFDPATRDGTPIDAWVLIPVRFVLR